MIRSLCLEQGVSGLEDFVSRHVPLVGGFAAGWTLSCFISHGMRVKMVGELALQDGDRALYGSVRHEESDVAYKCLPIE